MKHIKFKYRDEWSGEQWREQQCYVESLDSCISIYGLGVDCEYKILSIEDESGNLIYKLDEEGENNV